MMSDEREHLAESWQFTVSMLRRPESRGYTALNAKLKALLEKMGPPTKTLRQMVADIKREEIEQYGRELTREETRARLRKMAKDARRGR